MHTFLYIHTKTVTEDKTLDDNWDQPYKKKSSLIKRGFASQNNFWKLESKEDIENL